jgi:hypothetical protein
MAATNFKPEFTVCKTESDAFTGMIENHELVRKNSARRLHDRPQVFLWHLRCPLRIEVLQCSREVITIQMTKRVAGNAGY